MVAKERNEKCEKIYRISDFYDQNINKLRAERYPNSKRKIHIRNKRNDLERGFKCPYEASVGCTRDFASEGALNLHIKEKHNGGNKTDREKLAKALVLRQTKGYVIPDKLEVNLPASMVKEVAEKIQ